MEIIKNAFQYTDDNVTYRLAEDQLHTYAIWSEKRDKIIRSAYRAGLSKYRIHYITHIARTTIDRILENEYRN